MFLKTAVCVLVQDGELCIEIADSVRRAVLVRAHCIRLDD